MDLRPIGPAASMPTDLMSAPQVPPLPGRPRLPQGGSQRSMASPTGEAAMPVVAEPSEMQEAFTDFVGQTLFGSMLASMRKTVGKPAYMHGGRTEEVFQKQLDQVLVEELTDASADTVAGPMFELFNLQRRS